MNNPNANATTIRGIAEKINKLAKGRPIGELQQLRKERENLKKNRNSKYLVLRQLRMKVRISMLSTRADKRSSNSISVSNWNA